MSKITSVRFKKLVPGILDALVGGFTGGRGATYKCFVKDNRGRQGVGYGKTKEEAQRDAGRKLR